MCCGVLEQDGKKKNVDEPRIERGTSRMQSEHSTTELHALIILDLWGICYIHHNIQLRIGYVVLLILPIQYIHRNSTRKPAIF